MVAISEKLAEVQRVLDRYLVEVVEAYGFCPWARAARIGDEIGIAVLWANPTQAEWGAAARELLARPATRVAMVLAPELPLTPVQLRQMRDAVARDIATAGVADFHPDAELDLTTPARLVPFVRRSPDPLLQLVPLDLLRTVRSPPPVPGRAEQAQILGGLAEAPRGDIADGIAVTNHERVTRDRSSIEATLADIAADRRRSYARVGITIRTVR